MIDIKGRGAVQGVIEAFQVMGFVANNHTKNNNKLNQTKKTTILSSYAQSQSQRQAF